MKKILLSFFVLIGIGFGGMLTFAQENDAPTDDVVCPEQTITLVGTKKYLIGEMLDLVPSQVVSGTLVQHSFSQNDTLLTTVTAEKFTYLPKTSGTYTLQTILSLGSCKQVIDTSIYVYDDVVTIIGQVDEKLLEPYSKIFTQQSILVNTVPVLHDEWEQNLDLRHKIQQGKNIIISSNTIDKIFEGLTRLSESSAIDLKQKNITIVNTMNRNLTKRIISKYMKYFDSNRIYTTDKQNFLNLIASLANKEDITKSEYLTLFSLSEQKTPSYLFLSRMVDRLITHGFPIDLIGLLLTISLAVLAVSLFRQVIGFDIFGSYTPLMAGLSVYFLGLWLSLVLFCFAFVATILVRMFIKKIYLLYSAKISLLISLYFISIFIGLSYLHSFLLNVVDFDLFSNIFVIFPMLLIILVSEKLFYEGFKVTSKGRWISIVEFGIVSYVVYSIIHAVVIKNFMLSYPEIIVAVVLLIVLVGRFSGLQLLEYFRFYPLLKKHNQDEEE